MINRRQFLQSLSAGMYLPISMQLTAGNLAPAKQSRSRHLILIELAGGNDGLNTVIPYRDELYQRLRPTLAVRADDVVQLDETLGLHPALKPLLPLWKDKHMAIVNGLGYPEPNRSHFRSIEIWETASDADETLLDGWLKPVTEHLSHPHSSTVQAVALAEDQGPLAGTDDDTVVFSNLNQFIKHSRFLSQQAALTKNDSLKHILQVQQQTQATALQFAKSVKSQSKKEFVFPKNNLATQLKIVAELMVSQTGPRVFKVGMGSFDTHQGQVNKHANLLDQLASSVAALREVLQQAGLWDDVLVLTYSEFGRRAAENGSAGTDHGTAAPQFVFGGRVNGGMFGKQPSLDALENDDLVHAVDFRSLYRTISEDWLSVPDSTGKYSEFEKLRLV